MIKAIVFDFDGLVIDTETVWYSAFKEVLQDYGVEFPMEVFLQCVGTSDAAMHAFIEEEIGAESIETIVKLARDKHRTHMEFLDIREGVKEYLSEARDLGLRIGLASSSSREWVEGFLKKLGIIDYFEVIKTRDDVEKIKPDPMLYIEALKALNIGPKEAVAFEDSANGAKAAIAAGMHCVIVPNEMTKDLSFEKYHLKIGSMSEMSLARVIRQIENSAPHELDPNMRTSKAEGDNLTWHSPLEEPLRVSGLAWFDQERRYRRLPLHPAHPVRPEVDSLANCTSGGQVRFRTDSSTVSVRVRLTAGAGMYHMPPTGQCGVDAYTGGPGGWTHTGTASFQPSDTEYESLVFSCESKDRRSFMLNLPLYQGVEELWIGLEPDAEVLAPEPYDSGKKIIVYGTSITQGGCASRPGMSYTNILSRRMNLEFINLGFSGNGKGEAELAKLAAEIHDPACLMIDYEANCVSTENYVRTLPVFIQTYREHYPDVPIILISRVPNGAESFRPDLLQARMERKAFQADLARKLQEAGDLRITFVDGSSLLGSDPGEATVDGVHPTDLGFKRMADGLEPVLMKALASAGHAD